MLTISTVLLVLLSATSAHANLKLIPDFTLTRGDIEDYRLGDEWGKKPVTISSLKSESSAFVRAAMATAQISTGGTGFYIGKFNGVHVIATNHHVCPGEECEGAEADFTLLKKKFLMKKLFVTVPDIDLALLSLEVFPEDEKALMEVARNFSFKKHLEKGQELITIGFGIAGNPSDQMMGTKDSDCKVFSDTGKYKHLADPDEFNPADYKAWSFAHACDISHGDSGSAMVDRKTGDVVGIVWTGRIPKIDFVQKSLNLQSIFEESTPLVWKELSYAVPAFKMREVLKKLSKSPKVEVETRKVLKAVIL